MMNQMEMLRKYILYNLLLILMLTGIIACHSMTDPYDQFIENGEIIYPQKPDTIKVHPGKYRIRLDWLIPEDKSISKANIYWDTRSDSLVVPIDRETNQDTLRVLLTDMEEKSYSFSIFHYDSLENKSVKTTVVGRVYGDRYQKSLLPQSVLKGIKVNDELHVEWRDKGDDTVIGSEIFYTDTTGSNSKIFSDRDEMLTIIDDYNLSDSTFTFQTVYLPDSLAIDTFRTNAKTVEIAN